MNKYELVVIVDATLSQEQKEALMKEVTDAVTKVDGKVSNRQVWLEKQKFSFRMKGKAEGTYYVVNFESPASSALKIREALRLNEKLLRFLLITLD
jgi:small subunit ribosomal protein S6